eukprot:CAMPEP_0184707600 /NCGR_PEP_ID=MMETSP0313-20130426/37352_1 /TAXON_ID=2792 /ORGANISM="Porphyridium aerugineum, Strain SAG 1380-2" /LENGTH=630 /DNA_ID=CAMNT_0027169179 /DNA_START=44 /DNA_END=1934 /DNA_ORIENTATION=-
MKNDPPLPPSSSRGNLKSKSASQHPRPPSQSKFTPQKRSADEMAADEDIDDLDLHQGTVRKATNNTTEQDDDYDEHDKGAGVSNDKSAAGGGSPGNQDIIEHDKGAGVSNDKSAAGGGSPGNQDINNSQGGTASKLTGSRPKRARTTKDKNGKGADAEEELGRFHCNYCSRDLSQTVRIRCAECTDFDLCLDCFSVGATLHPHKSTHAYRIVEVVTADAFAENWGADEEERLLEGLELFGVGNWEGVSKLIGTKDATATEMHFLLTYLMSPLAPIPDPDHLVPASIKLDFGEEFDAELDAKSLKVMHLFSDEEVAGWMPKRGDFTYEWDNEAEDVLADMDITEDDTFNEQEVKTRVLEIYCAKLDARDKRKEFIVNRGLLEYKQLAAQEKKLSKEEKDMRDRIKMFMRFLPEDESKDLLRGIVEELSLRRSIQVLKDGRTNGAVTIAECHRAAANPRARKDPSYVEPTVNDIIQNAAKRRRPLPLGKAGDENGILAVRSVISDKCDEKQYFVGIRYMPGADLLNAQELELCQSMRMTPHQYLIVKEFLIRESCRVGHVKRKDARIVKLEANKVNKIFDYLVACGWVASGDAPGQKGGQDFGNMISGQMNDIDLATFETAANDDGVDSLEL